MKYLHVPIKVNLSMEIKEKEYNPSTFLQVKPSVVLTPSTFSSLETITIKPIYLSYSYFVSTVNALSNYSSLIGCEVEHFKEAPGVQILRLDCSVRQSFTRSSWDANEAIYKPERLDIVV